MARTVIECLLDADSQRMCKVATVACVGYYPDIFLEGLETPQKESATLACLRNVV